MHSVVRGWIALVVVGCGGTAQMPYEGSWAITLRGDTDGALVATCVAELKEHTESRWRIAGTWSCTQPLDAQPRVGLGGDVIGSCVEDNGHYNMLIVFNADPAKPAFKMDAYGWLIGAEMVGDMNVSGTTGVDLAFDAVKAARP